jgi:glycosyltransferase involved in cell wall biosynthesis
MKKLAIITPTRNAAEYLEECIESVRHERADGWVVDHILVDSGSTDGTLEIAERMGARVEHVDPIGVPHSMNVGIERAQADLIGFLGGDDTMLPGTAAVVSDWFDSRNHDFVTGTSQWIDSDGKRIGELRAAPAWMTVEMYAALGWSCLNMQSAFYTPELWERAGRYDETYYYSPDFEFFARCLKFDGFDRITRPLCTYRIHGNQLSIAPSDAKNKEDQSIVDTYAPPPGVKRDLQRYLMKAWVNASSPRWFLYKKLPGRTQAIIKRS